MRRTFRFKLPTLLLYFCVSSVAIGSQAIGAGPITPSGLNTQVGPAVSLPGGKTQYNITGGTRPGGGANIFHSFGDFNVPNNNIANFLNSGSVDLSGNALASGLPTTNILGRITGGNISNIFGMIQTNGQGGFGNANLFLMNPAGFLFGPNATVNVGGMVAFTTADYLRLDDFSGTNAGIFHANPSQASVLTTAPVAAFGFLGSNPGAITVQGSQLSVTQGNGISLVGGDIKIQSGTLDNGTMQSARLSAPNGTIQLASAASPGEFDSAFLTPLPNVNGSSFTSSASVSLVSGSIVDVSHSANHKISISNGNFILDVQNALLSTTDSSDAVPPSNQDNIVLSAGTSIVTDTSSADRGPDVQIVADSIQLAGLPPIPTPPNFVRIGTTTEGSGNAGNISLMATQNLDLTAAGIQSGSFPASDTAPIPTGNAGNISLTSTEGNISLTRFTMVTSQTATSDGSAGTLTLNAPHGDILVDSSAVFNSMFSPNAVGGGGGIQITANNLNLRHSSLPPAGISIDNFNAGVPGNIEINLSGSLSVDGGSFLQTVARGPAIAAADINVTAQNVSVTGGSFITANTISSGQGGQVNIFADNVQLTSGGQLRSGSVSGPDFLTGEPTIPSGVAGTINIHGLAGPAQAVLIDGAKSGIFTNAEGTGPAGNTNVATQSVTIQNGGAISAATTGTSPSATGGTININANQVQMNSGGVITADTNGIAPAGVVDINTTSLAISGGGQIRSSSGAETQQLRTFAVSPTTASPLTGGTITVQGQSGNGSVADSVTIDGADSGIFTQSTGSRPGGNINILGSQSVALSNGASISASSTGAGGGGSININGVNFSSNASTVSSSATQGTGGNINISAGNSVTLSNGASVSASSTGAGNAGNIQITAGNQFAMTNSTVTTEASQSGGGAIKITTNPNGTVQLTNSTISASVLDGNGGGGSVNIDPQSVVLINSQILAQAVQGPGGNINITTNLLLPDSTSVISASSQFGQQGTVIIQSPISPASGKIVPLGQKPLLATTLLSQRCAALAGGNASSFTVAGRDSLPAEPGGWVSSPLALSMVESNEGPAAFSEMAEGTPLLSLRRIAPPGFLTQSFAPNGSTDCTS